MFRVVTCCFCPCLRGALLVRVSCRVLFGIFSMCLPASLTRGLTSTTLDDYLTSCSISLTLNLSVLVAYCLCKGLFFSASRRLDREYCNLGMVREYYFCFLNMFHQSGKCLVMFFHIPVSTLCDNSSVRAKANDLGIIGICQAGIVIGRKLEYLHTRQPN